MSESNGAQDRYDPTGEAAIWQKAAALVGELRTPEQTEAWNAAITQAARVLESEARGIRQAGGMYYRVISGSGHEPLPE
ncbi:hypothetical protein [Nocardia flavorosea]|uniref:hypothetical protein n=1 Tax=Nocardia flavorosea TaxID=53429 RepID=UPI0024553D59|nr:hypothetical protein [Nocardia flavorosea]